MITQREPGFPQSLVCFGGVIAIVIVGLLRFGIDLHSLLIIAVIWTAGHAFSLGLRFAAIKMAMSGGIEKGLGAIYIFILIGVLVAALSAAGTVPSLIYYGVDLLDSSIFLPAGLILCSVMSLATGTAWGTIGTIGVVLMGLGEALGIPLPLVAGMVVSGASFGDQMSPVSDTTNLAAMSAETDLYAHIRSMLYTTVPSYVLALVAFTAVGLNYADQSLDVQNLVVLKDALAGEFVIGVSALLPLAVLLVLSVRRVAAEPSMLASVGVAVILAVAVQGRGVVDVVNSLNTGYVSNTGLEQIDTLLTRGGVQSMMWTLSLALIALALGGLLDRAGFVHVLLRGLLARITRSATLMTTTIASGIVANMSMGEGYLSIIFGGQIFKKSYEADGLERHLLSRCLEEGATLSTSLIPWTTSGAFCMGALGMSALDYAPWAFFNYITPLMSIILAYMGFGIFRKVVSEH